MDVAETAVSSKLNGTFALRQDQRMAPKVFLSGKDVFIPNWLEQEFSKTQQRIAKRQWHRSSVALHTCKKFSVITNWENDRQKVCPIIFQGFFGLFPSWICEIKSMELAIIQFGTSVF